MLWQNGRRFAHDIFKRLSWIKNEVNIFMLTPLKFVQVRVCQSNDKHIYAKNGIDNRHIYVSEIGNEKYIDRFRLYC